MQLKAQWKGMLQGGAVSASDISQSMAQEAQRRFETAVAEGASPPATAPQFTTSDLESLSGRYDTVTCLDVMIHYPQVRTENPGSVYVMKTSRPKP